MARKKAWWKKISIRSITSGLGRALNVLGAVQTANEAPPAQPVQVNVQSPGASQQLLLIGGAVALVLVVLLASRR